MNYSVKLDLLIARCGHCKRLKPEFEKSSGDLLRNDPPVHLVKVDCTEAGKETCGRFEVRGYPTLKIFKSGELSSDYNGPREAAGTPGPAGTAALGPGAGLSALAARAFWKSVCAPLVKRLRKLVAGDTRDNGLQFC